MIDNISFKLGNFLLLFTLKGIRKISKKISYNFVSFINITTIFISVHNEITLVKKK